MFRLHVIHDAKKVAAPELLDVSLGIAACQQLAGEVQQFRRTGQSADAAVTHQQIAAVAENEIIDAGLGAFLENLSFFDAYCT